MFNSNKIKKYKVYKKLYKKNNAWVKGASKVKKSENRSILARKIANNLKKMEKNEKIN